MKEGSRAQGSVKSSSTLEKFGSALSFIESAKQPEPPVAEPQKPAKEFDPCSGPGRVPPQFVILYRRPFLIFSIPFGEFPTWQVACVTVSSLDFFYGFDLRFNQIWNLRGLFLGDLASTMSLAPSEQLTLEFQSSQRRVLEQTAVDSAEELTSTESTTLDKEVVNAARSSSKTENWHVDGSGGFNIGIVKLEAAGGVQNSLTQTAQNSIEHVTEATTKSAHSLKTLHKIEVRGVTEGITQNRMTRVIKNPYRDRSLSLNVFQLIKHFSVKAQLAEVRHALFIQVNSLQFNNNFVVSNSDFLRDELLDRGLIDELPVALQGAKPLASSGTLQLATDTAKLALRYLYGGPGPESNIFNALIVGRGGSDLNHDPNDPANCFDAHFGFNTNLGDDQSGLGDSLRNNLGAFFTTLNLMFKVYQEKVNGGTLDASAIGIAKAIFDSVSEGWNNLLKDPQGSGTIRNILDEGDFTEIFRRLSGFLAIVSSMLNPILTPADEERKAIEAHEQAAFVLERLKRHLNCHKNYYIQRFLLYVASKSTNQDIIDFVNQVIDTAAVTQDQRILMHILFDVEGAFVDRQQIVVPGFRSFKAKEITEVSNRLSAARDGSTAEFKFDDVKPAVAEVELPCDGIHLEVAQGACILEGIPVQPGKSLELTIHDASLSLSGP
jgi:hypothetical protein